MLYKRSDQKRQFKTRILLILLLNWDIILVAFQHKTQTQVSENLGSGSLILYLITIFGQWPKIVIQSIVIAVAVTEFCVTLTLTQNCLQLDTVTPVTQDAVTCSDQCSCHQCQVMIRVTTPHTDHGWVGTNVTTGAWPLCVRGCSNAQAKSAPLTPPNTTQIKNLNILQIKFPLWGDIVTCD